MKKSAPEAARQAFSGAFRMVLSAALSCSGPGLGVPRSLSRDGRHRIPQLNQNCRRKSQILIVQPGGDGCCQGVDGSGQGQGVTSAVVHHITPRQDMRQPDDPCAALRRLYGFFLSIGNAVSRSSPSQTARNTSPSSRYPWRRRDRRTQASSFPARRMLSRSSCPSITKGVCT